jgi:glycosyltransferase involved in cell wall biosynthesis
MANYWAEAAHQITLLTFDDKNSPHYHISESIQWNALDVTSQSSSWIEGLVNNLKRIHVLRKFILQSEPDCVISFLYSTNILVLLATRFLPCKVIISERNYPKYSKEKRKAWFWLRKTLYPLADHLVVQTYSIKEYFRSYNGSVQVIPNSVKVDPESLYNKPEVFLPACNKLVAMGSMTTQKGFDLLIEVFANLYRHHSDWNLIILGEGALKNELKSRARELHIENAVIFAGRVKNPFSIMSRCDLFVLSSRYEGFPNALLEAMACGLPVVSFDCPTGPRQLIHHEINGLLVPPEDKYELEKALHSLMEKKSLREKMSKQAAKVRKRYAPEEIMTEWEKLAFGG